MKFSFSHNLCIIIRISEGSQMIMLECLPDIVGYVPTGVNSYWTYYLNSITSYHHQLKLEKKREMEGEGRGERGKWKEVCQYSMLYAMA